MPPTENVRRWVDWTPSERGGFASILVVEVVLVVALLLHGGRTWTPLVVIAGLGVLWIYDLAVERRHNPPGS